jgi:hypothetical protein
MTVELADATVLVVGEGLCMEMLSLVDPDSNSRGDDAIEVPELLIGALELDIKVLRLKIVVELIFSISKELLDVVLDVGETMLRVEAVAVVGVNVRKAEDELEPELLGTGTRTCAPQTFVFELAAPTELFK